MHGTYVPDALMYPREGEMFPICVSKIKELTMPHHIIILSGLQT